MEGGVVGSRKAGKAGWTRWPPVDHRQAGGHHQGSVANLPNAKLRLGTMAGPSIPARDTWRAEKRRHPEF